MRFTTTYIDGRPSLRAERGVVCFTWDDGWADILAVAALHEARGQRITIGVTNNLIGTANHLTEAQLKAVAANRHELAAHSVTHSNFVTELDATQRAAEYDQSKNYCEEISGRACTTWIYPFGGAARNTTTDQEVVGRFDRFCDTGVLGNWVAQDNRHPHFPARHLVRLNLDGTTENQSYALELIKQAAFGLTIPVFYCHQLDEPNAPTTAQYTALIDECVSLGIACLPLDEAFPTPPSLIDPGFEYATLTTAWKIVTSGDGAAESVADTPAAGLGGSRSLHVSCTTGFVYVTQPFPVIGGDTYTLSGRYRTSLGLGNATLTFRARQFRPDATQIAASTIGGPVDESTGWARFTKDLTAHAEAAYWSVDALLQPGTAGDAWVDHLDLGPKVFGSYG